MGGDDGRSLNQMTKSDQRGEFNESGCPCSVSESTRSVFLFLEDEDFSVPGNEIHENGSPSLGTDEDDDESVFRNSAANGVATVSSRSSAHNSSHEDTFPYKDLEEENSFVTEGWSACTLRKISRERSPSSEFSAEVMESKQEDKASYAESFGQDEPNCKRAKVLMPSRAELDEFFAVVEQQSRRFLTEKYNFDFENETPFDGRYEWVRLTP